MRKHDKGPDAEANAKSINWERAVKECSRNGPSFGDKVYGLLDRATGKEESGNGQSHETNQCIARKYKENNDKSGIGR